VVSPSARKAGARQLIDERGYTERRACPLTRISRTAYRYKPVRAGDESELVSRVRKLAHRHRCYGSPMIGKLLRREGMVVNHKRIERIWGQEGLSLRHRKRKKRRYGSPKGEILRKAERKNHVWTYDFMADRTMRGRSLKILTVLDEYTRESLALRVETAMGSAQVLETLEQLSETRGMPEYIRSDNGPEFIAGKVGEWLKSQECRTIFITPGSPWENPYIESFNGKFRNECLNMELFRDKREAQVVVEQWQREYNTYRPHSSLGDATPEEFAHAAGSLGRPPASLGSRHPVPESKNREQSLS
jgi:putative transposase